METIGVDIDTQFLPTMSDQPNSPNSAQPAEESAEEVHNVNSDEQRVTPEPEQADQNTFIPNGPVGSNPSGVGSNPSGEPGSNSSQNHTPQAEATIEALRSKIFETQATNEAFRSQNVALNQRIIRMNRDSQEFRQQQLDLITSLQDEIQQLKTKVTEIPKGKEGFSRK